MYVCMCYRVGVLFEICGSSVKWTEGEEEGWSIIYMNQLSW